MCLTQIIFVIFIDKNDLGTSQAVAVFCYAAGWPYSKIILFVYG